MITPDHCLFRNLDYLETFQGDFWTVVGNEHPTKKTIAFIKYKRAGQVTKDNSSGWTKNGINYERALEYYDVSQVVKTFDSLAADYLFYDNRLGFNMSCVPHEKLKCHYIPSLGLRKIKSTDSEELDTLQAKLLELVEKLSEETNVPFEKFGVTGSLLIGIQNPKFSDIDLVVNGTPSSNIRKYLNNNPDENLFSKQDGETLEKSSALKAEIFGIPKDLAKSYIQRRWNHGIFKNTRFSVHCVKEKPSFSFNDTNFEVIGEAKLLAEVLDTNEAFFYPCTWTIKVKEILESTKSVKNFGNNITELISYDGFYLDVLREKEIVEITGKVEKVKPSNKDEFYRIVVGGIGKPSKIMLQESTAEK